MTLSALLLKRAALRGSRSSSFLCFIKARKSSRLRLARQGWLVPLRTVQELMVWHTCLALHDLHQRCYQVNGQREDDGRIFLYRDLGQRLQVAQLQGSGL